ncbi:MAG TPA: S53 family peptidase, partial [Candidatus Dormibacteraeota bacterium]|nr:S53 family peptidase [Candidatus Dormibacteraeota bacterium]
AAAAPSGKAVVAGNVPPWATSANFKSAAAGGDAIGFRVYLNWSDPAAAEALALAVSDPASPTHGQFLTPAQFRQRFAPDQQTVGAVTAWLRDQGFSIDYVPANNHYVEAEGTVAQAEAAFGTTLGEFQVQGLTLRGPVSDISVPASIAPAVAGVIGLDESGALVHTNHIAADPGAPPAPAFVNAPPCSTFWAEKSATGLPNPYGAGALPYAPCGYTPQQIRGAYGLTGTTFDGSGQSVAVIDAYASPTIAQDVDQWSMNRGVPRFKGGQFTQVVAPGTFHHPESGGPNKQDPQGWYGEETLDIEAVHGMAPGASVVYVGAPNNFQDLDAALNHVVDRHLAQIVTNSYGFNTELLPPGFVKPYEQTIVQGAAEGIGIYFSSGDNSDESLVEGFATTDWPASSPFVTAVGGTSLAVGRANDYLFETGWGTTDSTLKGTAWSPQPPGSWLYGAGGGVSRVYAEPAYQQGVVPSGVFQAQGRTGRAVPDISALGDPQTGLLVGQTQTFPDGTVKYSEYRIGGTSLSSPIFAGIMALADQAKGAPHGFANPAIYALHGGAVLHDVVSPATTLAVVRVNFNNSVDASAGTNTRLRTLNQTLSLKTTPGYDDVTGVGTPAAGFLSALG